MDLFFFFLECRLAILLVSLKARIGRRCEFYPKIAEGERLREKREKRKDVTERSRTEQTTTTTTTKKKKKTVECYFSFHTMIRVPVVMFHSTIVQMRPGGMCDLPYR